MQRRNPKDLTRITVPSSCQMSTMGKTQDEGYRQRTRAPVEKKKFVAPLPPLSSKGGQVKNIYNKSEIPSVAQRLGLGLKCSIFKWTNNATNGEDKNMCNMGRPQAPVTCTSLHYLQKKHAIIQTCMITHNLMFIKRN